MDKIPSFTINHLKLQRGIYVSRKDNVGNSVVTTFDIRMKELPSVGIIELRDAETGHIQYVDTSSRRIRNLHAKAWQDHQQRLHQQFTRAGVRNVAIPTDGDYVRSLMQLFGERQASGR